MNDHLDRRRLMLGALALGTGAALGATGLPGPAGAGPAGFPTYRYLGQPLNKAALRYNPTGELIFPCVRGVYDKITGGLGRYYLYYAPHDAPGGICLAYGNSLAGPFTEYPANPIIARERYGVTHVSSPHTIWDAATKRFLLYFHGENTTTRLATSADGVHFTDHGVVLTTASVPGTSETSYARVFEHAIPGLGNRFVMLFMGAQSGIRRIFWGWSSDGRSWRYSATPLVWPSDVGESQSITAIRGRCT